MKEKKGTENSVPVTVQVIDERAELIRQITVLELKIITDFIQNRNALIDKIISQNGFLYRLMPLESADLIRAKNVLLRDFENLNRSKLAHQFRRDFVSNMKLALANIQNSPLRATHRNLIEQSLQELTSGFSRPEPLNLEDIMKPGYIPFDFEKELQRHGNMFAAQFSAKHIWRDYEHHLSEIVEYIKGALQVEPMNLHFKEAKESFNKTYKNITSIDAKKEYLLTRIERAKNSIANLKNQPHFLELESNQKYFSDGIEFLKYLEGLNEEINPKEEIEKPAKDKLTHKQQILLLHSIGFFDLTIISSLSNKQKGVLVSHVLNRTEKDSEDLIRYFGGKKKEKKFETKTPANIKAVKELLKQIGREDIRV